jgi:signal transduction histidine kinase
MNASANTASEKSGSSSGVAEPKNYRARNTVTSTLLSWLDQRRLFRTSAFQMTLIYAILFTLLTSATLGFIYWSTRGQIESQVDARLRLETEYLLNLYSTGAMPDFLEAIQRSNQIDTYGRFVDLDTSQTETNALEQSDEELPIRLKSLRSFTTRNLGDVKELEPGSTRGFSPVRVSETRLPNGSILRVSHEISDEEALLDHTFTLVLGATALTLIFSLIGGIWIGIGMLRRIDSVSRTASEIMSGDLSQRLLVTSRDDEFDEIATKLNQMLNRIEDLMVSMQQVTNNVAHDLRSPLTRLRNRLEVTLLEERDADNYRKVMDEAIGDADSLIHTFNAMLSIARLEAGLDSAQWEETHIGDLAAELSELYEAVAEEEEEALTFVANIRSNPVFHCNNRLIGQAVTNLLDNAIKYSPQPAHVSLAVEGNNDAFTITVADSGPGIPEHERDRVFERFVRLENERNSPGNGLGLSLVKAVMRIHNARLTLEDNNPGLKVIMHFEKRVQPGKRGKLKKTKATSKPAPAINQAA